jgi:ATP-dependent helicase YprA (DUF1998 family)
MINPISFTEEVISDFLKYQLSTYRFSDPDLYAQMRKLLNLNETRSSPLLKGPYISLSRVFRQGATLDQLAAAGVLHPGIATLSSYPRMYAHQEKAIRAITSDKHTIVSTGTGSGKTECFLYPIISRCMKLRDEGAPEGIVAVIVYPMNALAEDQRVRLRELLVGTGISFGMYTGNTPEDPVATSKQLPPGTSRAAYKAELERMRRDNPEGLLYPSEERTSRSEMRDPQTVPRILLTNVKQLEILLTRGKDTSMFAGARLEYLVFDEAHTFTGALGAETAALIRRLRTFCGKEPEDTVCIATSATIADPERGVEAGRDFAARFFGVRRERVELVGEEYESEHAIWSEALSSTPPPSDPQGILRTILKSLGKLENEESDEIALAALSGACTTLFGRPTSYKDTWREQLYRDMVRWTVPYQLAEKVKYPLSLQTLQGSFKDIRRDPISEEEILAWFALGAAARNEGRPLFRPVVHNFVRGIAGAQVTLDPTTSKPTLYLSGEDRITSSDTRFPFSVVVCTTCGQHYFKHSVAGLEPLSGGFGGGHQTLHGQHWDHVPSGDEGTVLYLFDKIRGESDDESEEDEAERSHSAKIRSVPLYVCTECGLLADHEPDTCPSCSRSGCFARVSAVLQKDANRGYFQRCVCCGKQGNSLTGRYREPVREIKAITAPDIHILAQSMIQNLERRRLLVFADNRQDAAFQAGWMKDHSRRYRFLNLVQSELKKGPTTLGDLVHNLDELFDRDKMLSFALLREVWEYASFNDSPTNHRRERNTYIRLQLLRELTRPARDTQGLEAWGRLCVRYRGLDPETQWVRDWAFDLVIPPEELVDDCSLFLDKLRRSDRCVFDKPTKLYTRFIERSDPFVQRGYIPNIDLMPKIVKVRYESNDKKNYTIQLASERGQTAFSQMARKWGVPSDHFRDFAESFFRLLVSKGILVAADVENKRGNPIPGASGYQVNVESLLLTYGEQSYRCSTCHQIHSRRSSGMKCVAWNCDGTLLPRETDADDFDLMMLDREVAILQPEEHSAQVPAAAREKLERDFKDEHYEIPNTLVCTPTLEMGVDIGSLDCILMRNMPPLPANYWQRVGRAGRRHRIAVDITYARPASFDQAYFKDPLKLLMGMIDPPSFNLRNEKLIEKHAHSAVIGWFRKKAEAHDTPADERDKIQETLASSFPSKTGDYVFTDDRIDLTPRSFSALASLINEYRGELLEMLQRTFTVTWPPEDKESVQDEILEAVLDGMANALTETVRRLRERIAWAQRELQRISSVFNDTALYDPLDRVIESRLKRFLSQMRPSGQMQNADAISEESFTLSYLALEGFLPGYGLDTGSILGEYSSGGAGISRALSIRRNPAVALREFAPGNLLYALGSKYIPRRYHLGDKPPLAFNYDPNTSTIVEEGLVDNSFATPITGQVLSLELQDTEILHYSTISDEEDYRFSMPSTVLGMSMESHEGGVSYRVGNQEIRSLKNYQFRLINLGPGMIIGGSNISGFPICRVCGYSTSPYSSDAEKKTFWDRHVQTCQQPHSVPFALHIEDAADVLLWLGFETPLDAYSTVEAIRKGAAAVLDMEEDDLQLLGLPQDGGYSMMLYDPMPGGSGLLDQILVKWEAVLKAALSIVEECPSRCETACIDCLYSYRNSQYHRFLDRKKAAEHIGELLQAGGLQKQMDIPQKIPQAKSGAQPLNNPEGRLRKLLIKAGLPEPEAQRVINLGGGLGTTIPDFYYHSPNDQVEGICIYLDGMHTTIHGNAAQSEIDARKRTGLENLGYMVVVITFTELSDRNSLSGKFYRIARALIGRAQADRIRDSEEWFEVGTE